jgi:predicted transcriptional regulator
MVPDVAGGPGDDYDHLVRRARARLGVDEGPGPVDGGEIGTDGPVQLSVRLSPALRAAVTEAARRQGRSLTGFVVEALEEAVRLERDPFAALAAELAAGLRAELAHALESGAYPGTPTPDTPA